MNDELNQLTPIELLVLQKHLKLGTAHLKRRLNQEEVSYLLDLEKNRSQTTENLAVYAPELLGNVSLALNSIFTAILGTWSGMSGLLRFHLSLPSFFTVLSFCTMIGGWVGFNHYKLIRKTTQDALEKKKTMSAEIHLLKNLNQQRQAEITTKITEINQILKNLQIEGIDLMSAKAHEFNDLEICLDWLKHTEIAMKELHENKPGKEALLSEIEKSKTLIQNRLNAANQRKEGKTLKIIQKLGVAPILPHVSFAGWLKTNFRKIIVSLTPVVFGGFSSLLVYVGGAPKLAEDTGMEQLALFLSQPGVKYTELVIAACITLYFSIAVLYVNRQAYIRDKELSKTEVILEREETELDLLDDKLLKIKQITEFMKPIERIHRVLKEFNLK